MTTAKISVYIIAYNEAEKISDAINSVSWANEVLVIDSNSHDATAEIAKQLGAEVIQVPFQGFGHLRNQAIAACQYDWIFSLDADERCTVEARKEIESILSSQTAKDVYFIPRKNFFMGRWIKYSWPFPNYRQPQLFRKNALRYKEESVHEGYILREKSRVDYIKNPIIQIPFANIDQMLHKMNRYSTLGVERLLENKSRPSILSTFIHGYWSFFKHYVLKRGFLDGWPGFIIALSNFEGTFYRYAKLVEYSHRVKTESKL